MAACPLYLLSRADFAVPVMAHALKAVADRTGYPVDYANVQRTEDGYLLTTGKEHPTIEDALSALLAADFS